MKSLLKIVCLNLMCCICLAQSVTILPDGITPAMAGNIPRLSYDAIMALPSPMVGNLATDTTFNCLRFYDGKQWAKVQTSKDSDPISKKATVIGGAGDEYCNDIAVDAVGNLYMAGNFNGTASFGNTTLTSYGGSNDIFIVKYNKQGIMQWVKQAGGTTADGVKDIAVDSVGNVILTGFFKGTANFDNATVTGTGNEDVYVAKYSNAGNLIWVRKAGGIGSDLSTAVAVDKNGNVFITGTYNAGAVFGTKTILNMGETDIFVARYSSDGNFEWVKTAGGLNKDNSTAIAIDASGALYITGNFTGATAFGNTTLTSEGEQDIFIAKYNYINDSWAWAIRGGGSSYDISSGIAIDAEGNVLVGGGFQNYGHFGNYSLKSAGDFDTFLAKYTPEGTVMWAKRKGGIDTDYITNMAVDVDGNVYAVGFFRGIVDFGDKRIEAFDNADIFFVKFRNNGAVEWAQSAGSAIEDIPSAIAVQPDGNAFAITNSYVTIEFGNLTVNPVASRDIFLFRIRD